MDIYGTNFLTTMSSYDNLRGSTVRGNSVIEPFLRCMVNLHSP
nr:MAG TPA: hypothetical protein [Bacteriophage sp.]